MERLKINHTSGCYVMYIEFVDVGSGWDLEGARRAGPDYFDEMERSAPM